MGTGYTRTDVANNIANGKVADADDLDAEFNAIDAAFNEVSGHTHDGTADEGAPITVIGPAQEYVANGSSLSPKTDDTYDLGTVSLKWRNLYIDGTAFVDTIRASSGQINNTLIGDTVPTDITGTTITANTSLTVAGVEVFNASTGHDHDGTAGNGAPITVVGPAQEYISSGAAFYPKTDDTYDLGTNTFKWKDLYVDGTAYLDVAQITGGQINNANIGNTSPATITGTNVTVTGTFTLGGTAVTSTATQLNYLNTATSNIQTQLNTLSSGKQPLDATLTDFAAVVWTAGKVVVTDGTDSFTGYNLRDQDDMAANDAAGIPTQQSVKAYADSFGWTLVESITSFTSGQAETSTFESGFEYLIFVNNLNFTKSASNQALGIEVYKGTSAAYHSSTLNVSNATTNTGPYFNGTIYLPNITRSLDRHFFNAHISVSGTSTTGEAGINFGVTDNGCFSLASAESITKVRIGNSAWTYNSGNFTVYKRRIS